MVKRGIEFFVARHFQFYICAYLCIFAICDRHSTCTLLYLYCSSSSTSYNLYLSSTPAGSSIISLTAWQPAVLSTVPAFTSRLLSTFGAPLVCILVGRSDRVTADRRRLVLIFAKLLPLFSGFLPSYLAYLFAPSLSSQRSFLDRPNISDQLDSPSYNNHTPPCAHFAASGRLSSLTPHHQLAIPSTSFVLHLARCSTLNIGHTLSLPLLQHPLYSTSHPRPFPAYIAKRPALAQTANALIPVRRWPIA